MFHLRSCSGQSCFYDESKAQVKRKISRVCRCSGSLSRLQAVDSAVSTAELCALQDARRLENAKFRADKRLTTRADLTEIICQYKAQLPVCEVRINTHTHTHPILNSSGFMERWKHHEGPRSGTVAPQFKTRRVIQRFPSAFPSPPESAQARMSGRHSLTESYEVYKSTAS